MKYVKSYNSQFAIRESRIQNLKVGDYVICNEIHELKKITLFLNNNIGKILIREENNKTNVVQYENIPADIYTYFSCCGYVNSRRIFDYEIIQCSKNKKDLEIYINQNKYNL